eukprot:198798-Pyramimonas_sp.AAC.1
MKSSPPSCVGSRDAAPDSRRTAGSSSARSARQRSRATAPPSPLAGLQMQSVRQLRRSLCQC